MSIFLQRTSEPDGYSDGVLFQATHDRFTATEGTVLVSQDTSEFSYQREKPELIGTQSEDRKQRLRAARVRFAEF